MSNDPFHTTPFLLTIPIVTDASGDFTLTTTAKFSGMFLGYRYVAPAADALDANWDLDVVGATTGIVLIDEDNLTAASVTKLVQDIVYDTAGNAVTYDGTNEIYGQIPLCGEALTITVAQGGVSQSGTLHLFFHP